MKERIMKIWVFGCSFTRYYWPTWADILRWSNPNIEVVNMAEMGLGNQRIFWRMQEAKLKGYIADSDLTIAVWAAWHREDRFVDDQWTVGNIFNSGKYCDTFINKYWDEHLDIIRNASSIISANDLLDISHNGSMIKVGKREEYNGSNVPVTLDYRKYFNQYNHYTSNFPNIIEFDHSTSNYFNNKCHDRHPDIMCHYDYYKKVQRSIPELKDADEGLIYDMQQSITDAINPDLKGRELYTVMIESIEKFIPNWKQDIGLHEWKWQLPINGFVC